MPDCTCLAAATLGVHSAGCDAELTKRDVAPQPGRITGEVLTGPELSLPTATPQVDHRRVASARAVTDLLTALQVPADEHTANTPDRVARAFIELLAGYTEDPGDHLDRRFPGPDDAGLVVLQGIRFVSLCAHHLLPFTGTGTVAYLPAPGSPIVGLSKLARLLEGYARRLQTQEVLGSQVVEALDKRLSPIGAACIITAHHACMGIRGVKQPDAVMTTSSLRGAFRDDPSARAELMALHQSAC